MLDSTLAVVEPLLLLQSPIDEDEPAIMFVEEDEIVFRWRIRMEFRGLDFVFVFFFFKIIYYFIQFDFIE